jgi:hypothetical protein
MSLIPLHIHFYARQPYKNNYIILLANSNMDRGLTQKKGQEERGATSISKTSTFMQMQTQHLATAVIYTSELNINVDPAFLRFRF